MQSTTRCVLLACLALAIVSSCFSQIPRGRVARQARGGEQVGVKVPELKADIKDGDSSGPDLFGLLVGGVVGIAVAAGKAIEGIVKAQEVPVQWQPSQEPGAVEPVGFFDPLDFAEDEEKFRKFRIAEIKHGRVAMMAAAGAVVQHFVKLPPFKDVPSGIMALQSTPGLVASAVLFAACGVMETKVWKQEEDKEPGNFGDPANWSVTGLGGGSYSREMRERELVNGRFAMLAIMGIFAAELATGKDAVQQLAFKTMVKVAPVVTEAAPVVSEASVSA